VQWKVIDEETNGRRTFAIIFETGDEVMAGLRRFLEERPVGASQFSGIGAFSDAVVAYFDWQTKDYLKIPIREQVEVLVLSGDVSDEESGKSKLHAHVVVGKRDGSAHGGHLMEAHVRPTLELILTESPKHLVRRFDKASGLSLIRVEGDGQ
jgi:predicted DNA-binding protein with PD1-like motif